MQMFYKYVKLGTEQLVSKIRNFEEEWVPRELETSIKVTKTTPRKQFIVVQSKLFLKYIVVQCGIIHDCKIAEIASDLKSVLKDR